MSDKYVKVECILIVRTKDAICVDVSPIDSEFMDKRWIPLSLIHGADEARIGNDHSSDVVSFRLMDWKARELGL